MMKLLYPLLSLLLLSTQVSNAQSKYNFGEGIVQVQLYFAPALNLEHPDTANHLFTTYTYYVKGDKVLRNEDAPSGEMVKSKSSLTNGNIVMESAFEAKLAQPVYLLDFGQNKSYVYYSKHDTSFASVSTIVDQKLDLCYKALLLPARQANRIVTVSDNGTGCGINGSDTSYFQYSKKALPIPSPLNNFYSSPQTPYLTLIWAPTPCTGKDGSTFMGYAVLNISKVEPMHLPDSLFSVRPGVILKENAKNYL